VRLVGYLKINAFFVVSTFW